MVERLMLGAVCVSCARTVLGGVCCFEDYGADIGTLSEETERNRENKHEPNDP